MKLTNPNQSELNIRSTDLFENAQENLTKIVSAKSRSLNCNQPTPVTPSKITNHLSWWWLRSDNASYKEVITQALTSTWCGQ